jgi:hypothetical protein
MLGESARESCEWMEASWKGIVGEPMEDDGESVPGAASESDEESGSASAWASRLSRSERLMSSSSIRRGVAGGAGRRSMVVVAMIDEGRVRRPLSMRAVDDGGWLAMTLLGRLDVTDGVLAVQ